MNQAVRNSLTEPELVLVRSTEPAELAGLDEDELLELHDRIRRARTKYVKQYRRGAATSVAERGGRGHAFPRNQRARDKAEVFETALARVSRSLASAARASSAALKAERLAAAKADRGSGPATGTAAGTGGPAPSTRRRTTKTTGGVKKDASSRAQGARRQAARDAR